MFFSRSEKRLSLYQMLPNILTLGVLCSGMTALRFVFLGHWEKALAAIFVAGLLDGLDGRLARLLRGTSKFGAELDSLSDAVSFGVAPAFLFYFWGLWPLGSLGWAIGLLFAICAVLRLARFNTALEETSPTGTPSNAMPSVFFKGIPVPAGAILASLPILISFEWPFSLSHYPAFFALWVSLVALGMVSTIPTFSFKKTKIPHLYVIPIMVGFGVLAAFLISSPWTGLACLALLYLGLIPLSIYKFYK